VRYIYIERKRVGNKEKFLVACWCSLDSISQKSKQGKNKLQVLQEEEKYSPQYWFPRRRKKQRANEWTKHSFNVANEKKRGTQTPRPQNRGIRDYFSFLFSMDEGSKG
jgi:hypothetical protein